MTTLKESLKCLLLACACALAIALAGVTLRAPKIANQQMDATRAALVTEQRAWLDLANRRLVDALADLNVRASDVIAAVNTAGANADKRTGEALEIVRTGVADADIQIGAAREELNGQLMAINKTAAVLPGTIDMRLGETNQILSETAAPIRETIQQLDDAAPLFLDCDHNEDCLFNREQGIAKSAEQVGKSAAGIAADIKREADQLTAPQTKLQQLRAWLLAIARIYGAI